MPISEPARQILHVDFTELSLKKYENRYFMASIWEAHFGAFLGKRKYHLLASAEKASRNSIQAYAPKK